MATVFLARVVGVGGFQRLFAIKRLHPHLARDGEFIQMFLDEARLAARIHHPNVVPIHEVGTSDRGHYLVMDFIEGDTEARLFAKAASLGTKVSPAVGIRIALDTLAGLHAAHELRDDAGEPLHIVHRDVSPQNVLVGIDGIARITDFGVARASTRLSVTKTGQLKGKLAYMAPEQARSKQAIDRRADVFAMGIVLWETLAFRRLFKGDSEAETLNRVLYEPIPTLRSAAPTIPASLDAIVMKCLERDPDKRFATAAELADALEKAAHALKCIAAPRDVVQCVQEVIGAEIEQQREAVRAWLARSEPSRSERKVPVAAESLTKVERPGGSMTPPPGVTSVSSAVMQVPSPPSSGVLAPVSDAPRRSSAPPQRRRGWTGVVAFASLAVLGAAGAFAWRATPRHVHASTRTLTPTQSPTATPPLTPPPSPTQPPSPSPTPTPPASPASAGPIAAKDAGADATRPKAAPAPPPRPHRRPQASSPAPVESVQPSAPPATTAKEPDPQPPVPDDITVNPYR